MTVQDVPEYCMVVLSKNSFNKLEEDLPSFCTRWKNYIKTMCYSLERKRRKLGRTWNEEDAPG